MGQQLDLSVLGPLAECAGQQLRIGALHRLDEFAVTDVECGGGFELFAENKPCGIGAEFACEDVVRQGVDEMAYPLATFGCAGVGGDAAEGVLHVVANRLPQVFGGCQVQLLLAAKVVGDRRDIGLRLFDDFTGTHCLVVVVSEGLERGAQQAFAGPGFAVFGAVFGHGSAWCLWKYGEALSQTIV